MAEKLDPDDELRVLLDEADMPIDELMSRYASEAAQKQHPAHAGYSYGQTALGGPSSVPSTVRRITTTTTRRRRTRSSCRQRRTDVPASSSPTATPTTTTTTTTTATRSSSTCCCCYCRRRATSSPLEQKQEARTRSSTNNIGVHSHVPVSSVSLPPSGRRISSRRQSLERSKSSAALQDSDIADMMIRSRKHKPVCIGNDYQAKVADSIEHEKLTDANEVREMALWVSGKISEAEVVKYIKNLIGFRKPRTTVPDDEEALLLLHCSRYSVASAIRKWKHRTRMDMVRQLALMEPRYRRAFTGEDCDGFETGLVSYGKDFRKIRSEKLPNRSVKELVNFYYLWKKSVRHDQLLHKIAEITSCSLLDCTDLMDKCQVNVERQLAYASQESKSSNNKTNGNAAETSSSFPTRHQSVPPSRCKYKFKYNKRVPWRSPIRTRTRTKESSNNNNNENNEIAEH